MVATHSTIYLSFDNPYMNLRKFLCLYNIIPTSIRIVYSLSTLIITLPPSITLPSKMKVFATAGLAIAFLASSVLT
jgi:hypothetical protein